MERYQSAPKCPEKWNLLSAIKAAYEKRSKLLESEDYIIPIIVE